MMLMLVPHLLSHKAYRMAVKGITVIVIAHLVNIVTICGKPQHAGNKLRMKHDFTVIAMFPCSASSTIIEL